MQCSAVIVYVLLNTVLMIFYYVSVEVLEDDRVQILQSFSSAEAQVSLMCD